MKTKKQLLLEEISKAISADEFNEDWKTLYKMDVTYLIDYLKAIKKREKTKYFELIED